jgi:hypothetical protein
MEAGMSAQVENVIRNEHALLLMASFAEHYDFTTMCEVLHSYLNAPVAPMFDDKKLAALYRLAVSAAEFRKVVDEYRRVTLGGV